MSTLFSGHYLRNRSTLDIGVLGYIGIVQHKEHSPEVFHIPPGTPVYIYIHTYMYMYIYTYTYVYNMLMLSENEVKFALFVAGYSQAVTTRIDNRAHVTVYSQLHFKYLA